MTALRDAIDYTTLGWVKPELDETLRQARIEIEGFAEDPTDGSRMRFCASYLHQVQGTLRMVELYAPAMVAEEMEHLAQALQVGDISDRDGACSTLMRGVVLLPDYLERLQSGHKDIPIVLLPLLNELRAARGEAGLSESVLFSPDLERPLPADLTAAVPASGPTRNTEAAPLLARLREAMAAWPEHGAPADASELREAIEALLSRTEQESARRMLWVASLVMTALQDGAMPVGAGLRQAFASVERETRRLFEDDGFGMPRAEAAFEPTRQLLYHVAHTYTEHRALQTLRTTFDLSGQMPSESELEHARGSLTGRNRALLDTVSAAVKEDLLRVKDALDLHLRSGQSDVSGLLPQVEALGRVADTLGMLGLGVARNVVQQQREAMHAIVRGDKPADEGALLDVAGALLYVDATLDDQVARLGDSDVGTNQDDLFSNESRKVLEVIVREAIANFADARQAFVAFVETSWDHGELVEVPRLLNEVAGALNMLELPQPAAYLTGVRRYTETELIGRRRVPNGRLLDTLADALASLEYYLEALREQRGNRDEILDIARNSLEGLGYWPLPPEEVVEAPSEDGLDVDVVEDHGDIDSTVAAFIDRDDRVPQADTADTVPAFDQVVVAHVVAPVAPAGIASGGFEATGDEIDDEIRDVFLEEFEEEIGNLDAMLPAWRANPEELERLRPIRRVFHTLKGSGRLVGARTLGEFSWKIENMLNRVLDGSHAASPAVIAMVDQAFYTLPQLHAALRGEGMVTADLDAIQAMADRVAGGEEVFYTAPAFEAVDITAAADTAADDVVAEDMVVEGRVVEGRVVEEVALDAEIGIAEADDDSLPASVDQLLLEILDTEVTGHLATVDAWVDQARSVPAHVDDALLRSIHTMNGAFAMTEVPSITGAIAPAEGYVRRLLAARLDATSEGVEAIADLAAAIRRTMTALQSASPRVARCDALAARLLALRDSLPEAVPVAEAAAAAIAANADDYDSAQTPAFAGGDLTELDMSAYGDLASDDLGPTPIAIGGTDAGADDTADAQGSSNASLLSMAEQFEAERLEAEREEHEHAAAEAERVEAERAEVERVEAERAEAERAEAERAEAERAEAERAEAERAEAERAEAERAEAERLEAERLETERREAARIEEEERLEYERLEAEYAEADRIVREQALEAARLDAARSEAERLVSEQTETERLETERLEAERLEAERLETERLETERLEAERLEAERLEAERLEAERLEAERLEAERLEAERLEAERLEVERLEVERLEAERLEAERLEAERLEAERLEAERLEAERLEAERLETERLETERLEAKRLEAEQQRAALTDKAAAAEPAEAVSEPAVAALLAGALASGEDPDAALDLTDLDPELIDIFVEEAGDLLDHSDGLLAQLRDAPGEREPLVGLQRDLHTLKGGARMAGIMAIGELGHAMESLLEAVVEQRSELGRDGVPLLERGFDRLHAMVTRVGARHAVGMPEALISEFDLRSRGAFAETSRKDVPKRAPKVLVELKPLSAPINTALDGEEDDVGVRAPQEQVRIRADLLDRLVNYAGEVAIYRARLEQQLGAFRSAMAEMEQTNARLRDQLRRLDSETEAQIIARYQREHEVGDETFDPLELDRFSTLQQLSRGLAESAADMSSLQGTLDDLTSQYETLLLQQSRVSSDLQQGLMRTRMVPFDALVPRLRRVVRQAATETGKQVQLKLDGAQGELDRNVLERMTAPLEHMLRNAVAHGLESPEQRRKAKKPEEGTVRIAVRREGSEVVLEVSDDGGGLNRPAIRRRAEARGLVRADAILADADLDTLILEPGFSTADEVSRLAGRGVGMDVVASEVRQLGGALDISSRKGEGTAFTLRLPQTLAVTQAVFVRIGEASFAVPIASVRGVGRIAREELDKPGAVYNYGGEEYALHDLGALVGHGVAKAEGQMQMPLLLIRSGDLRAAVSIDQVIGNREIVVKPVGPQVASVPGIFGATIMGDGSVVVILDIAPLVRRQATLPRDVEPAPAVEQRRVPLVMVVDDSVTMRKVTGRVLERHNFEVGTAKDGIDALERMAERVPDLMLLDIEMPRMDGYELATQMKADARLRNVPIIMITSRTGDKHRQRAFEIGVERYLGKPYQEHELIRNVFDLLAIERANE